MLVTHEQSSEDEDGGIVEDFKEEEEDLKEEKELISPNKKTTPVLQELPPLEFALYVIIVVGHAIAAMVRVWYLSNPGLLSYRGNPSPPLLKDITDYEWHIWMDDALFTFVEYLSIHSIFFAFTGFLCLNRPWPALARTIHGDHQRYVDTYFAPGENKRYFTGDGAHVDEEGYWQITGRIDDVINISGHRLGTAEVEDVLDEHEDVAECAVVGFKHELKGEAIFAFVTLKEHVGHKPTEIIQKLRERIKTSIASYAVPEAMLIVPALPKTRSGKIMRRILRQVVSGKTDQLGDTSTLADPSVVGEIVTLHGKHVTL